MDQPRRPPGLVHQVDACTRRHRRSVREPEVARCAHGVGCCSGNAEFGPHRGVLFESARSQQYTATRPNRPPLTLALHDTADDPAVVDDQLHEPGVQMSRDCGIVGHRGEEPADERPAAGEQVRLRRTEAFMIQRSTNQPLEPAKPVVGHRQVHVTHCR